VIAHATAIRILASAEDDASDPPAGDLNPNPKTPPPSSGGLSSGAKAGVGVALGALLLLGIAGALALWRRRRQKRSGIPPDLQEAGDTQRFEKDGKEITVPVYYELDAPFVPLSPVQVVTELQGNSEASKENGLQPTPYR